jgi:hypothetical protein
MLRRNVLWAAAALGTGGARLIGATSYEAEIAEWRKNYDRDLRSENGPLWLIARHDAPEGKTGIGSDSYNVIMLLDKIRFEDFEIAISGVGGQYPLTVRDTRVGLKPSAS